MKKLSWFTFIEIAIAIFVFSVGILVVLQVMTSNLSMVAQSQTKTTAAMLAQEGIALTFSLRDANRAKWYGRDCIPAADVFTKTSPTEETFCQHRMRDLVWTNNYLLLWFSPDSYMSIQIGQSAGGLFIHTGDYYYLSYSWSVPSIYNRYIRFDAVLDQWQQVSSDHLLKVTSVVTYQQWARSWEVQLESFIWAR